MFGEESIVISYNDYICEKNILILNNSSLSQDEIFDMVKPKDPFKITLQDLVNSCQGDTVSSILIDLNGFWTYENREVLVTNDGDSNVTGDMDDTWTWVWVLKI